jgi:hypothetical protein
VWFRVLAADHVVDSQFSPTETFVDTQQVTLSPYDERQVGSLPNSHSRLQVGEVTPSF